MNKTKRTYTITKGVLLLLLIVIIIQGIYNIKHENKLKELFIEKCRNESQGYLGINKEDNKEHIFKDKETNYTITYHIIKCSKIDPITYEYTPKEYAVVTKITENKHED